MRFSIHWKPDLYLQIILTACWRAPSHPQGKISLGASVLTIRPFWWVFFESLSDIVGGSETCWSSVHSASWCTSRQLNLLIYLFNLAQWLGRNWRTMMRLCGKPEGHSFPGIRGSMESGMEVLGRNVVSEQWEGGSQFFVTKIEMMSGIGGRLHRFW